MVQALKKLNGETRSHHMKFIIEISLGLSIPFDDYLIRYPGGVMNLLSTLGMKQSKTCTVHHIVATEFNVDMAIIHTGINIYIYSCTTYIDFLAQHPKYPLHYASYCKNGLPILPSGVTL